MELELLAAKAQAGDGIAAALLYKRFAGMIKKLAGQAHLAAVREECLAEGNLAFWEAVMSYSPSRGVPLSGYAYSRVKYRLWNYYKQRRRVWRDEVSLETSVAGDRARADIADSVVTGELRERLAEFDRLITPKQRYLFRWLLNGGNMSAAADMLGVTPQAVFRLRQRVRTKLRRFLDK